jgi:hypothetical protein
MTRDQDVLSWSAGIAFVIAGIAVALVYLQIPPVLVSAWILISIATLLIAEADLLLVILRWIRSLGAAKIESAGDKEAAPDYSLIPRFRRRRQVELLLILFFASSTFLPKYFDRPPTGSSSPTQPAVDTRGHPCITQPSQSNCLSGIPDQQKPPTTPSETKELTLRMSPALEGALLAFLANTVKAQAHFSWWPVGALGAIVLVVAIIALAWLLRKRPKEAAPLSALALAAAVLKDPEEFSHLSPLTFYLLFGLLVCVTIVLIVLCVWKFKLLLQTSDRQPDSSETAKESESPDAPLTIVFSVFVLVWSLIAVAYHADQSKTEPPKTSSTADAASKDKASPGPEPRRVGNIQNFPPVSGFLPKADTLSDGHASLIRLEQGLAAASLQPNDVLLLIGSSDCAPIKHNPALTNKALAENRASWVKNQIQKNSPKMDIRVESLEQHQNCKVSEELRAVFPIMIRADEKSK